jgi:hypothetical protein
MQHINRLRDCHSANGGTICGTAMTEKEQRYAATIPPVPQKAGHFTGLKICSPANCGTATTLNFML